MKLYHATPVENTESVKEVGIVPTDCGTKVHGDTDTLQGRGLTGIYGFITMDDAVSFAQDNGNEYAIFAIETSEGDELIEDPEYTGEAMFVVTDEPITAELIEVL